MALVQSVIDRCVFVTKDVSYTRFSLDEMIAYTNDAINLMAQMSPRSASRYMALSLAGGSRQDLRGIDQTQQWVRLFELVCNMQNGQPNGTTIRQVARAALDNSHRAWRSTAPADEVREFTMDEREPYTFDVFPPVQPGTQVYALAAIVPPPVEDEDSEFPLDAGFIVPCADYVLYKLFCKDANEQSYMARATGHLQAFNLAMGVEVKDTAQ